MDSITKQKIDYEVSKVIMSEFPQILYEAIHTEKDTFTYFKKDDEKISVTFDEEKARKLSKAAVNIAKYLVYLSNRTDGFFGPEIRNVEGKTAAYSWGVINAQMIKSGAKFHDAQLRDAVLEAYYLIIREMVNTETRSERVAINRVVWAITSNAASRMQNDNRFLRHTNLYSDTFFEVAESIYNDLLGYVTGNFNMWGKGRAKK